MVTNSKRDKQLQEQWNYVRTGETTKAAQQKKGPAKPKRTKADTIGTGRGGLSKPIGGKPPAPPQTPDRKRDPEFRRGPGAGAGDMNAGKTPAPRPTSSAPAPAQPARAQRPTPKPVPSPAKPAATSAGKPQKWSDFNPNRGTSKTNNPLIKKDDWMMSRMKDREANQQASAAQSVGNKFDSTRDVYTPSTKVDGSAFAEKSGSQKLKFALEQQREKEKQRQQQQLLASRKPGSRY